MSQLLGNTNIICSIYISILFNRIKRVFLSTSTFFESQMSYWVNPEKICFPCFSVYIQINSKIASQIRQFSVFPKDDIFNIIDYL
jgi:hypothetical protein